MRRFEGSERMSQGLPSSVRLASFEVSVPPAVADHQQEVPEPNIVR